MILCPFGKELEGPLAAKFHFESMLLQCCSRVTLSCSGRAPLWASSHSILDTAFVGERYAAEVIFARARNRSPVKAIQAVMHEIDSMTNIHCFMRENSMDK